MKSLLKQKSTKIVITLLLLIFFLICLNTIVYSAFSSTMNVTGIAHSRVEADVRVTNFSLDEAKNATSKYEEFGKDHISTSIEFEENAYTIYKVEVTNYGELDVGIFSIDGIPEDITYELINYNVKAKLCNINGKCNKYATKIFYIKLQGNNITKDLNITFNFKVFRKITYINFSNEYISEVMDGDSIDIDLSKDSPKLVSVSSENNTDYFYSNNILSITNVSNDLVIEAIYNTEYEYGYTGNYQTFTVPYDGMYKIELWGASGGDDCTNGIIYTTKNGLGGYTSGTIALKKNTNIYMYVGGQGATGTVGKTVAGGYNGGGTGSWDGGDDEASGGGGGATDVRLVSGTWNNDASLKSRIMVAGGGSSEKEWRSALPSLANYISQYMAAGGLQGYTSVSTSKPGTQTSGYKFGIGQNGTTSSSDSSDSGGNSGQGGGGGGYYGGTIGQTDYLDIGAGGSSFISGHNGCVAIESSSSLTPKKGIYDNSCTDGTTDIICSYHYSEKSFIDTIMIDGAGYSWTTVKGSKTGMPSHDGTSTMYGNSGNGYAKITLLDTITEYNITYVSIAGTYQTRVKAGKDLVVDFGTNAPLKLEVRVGNQKVDHIYQNNVLILKNIQGNVTINKIKTVYDFSYTGNSQTFKVPYSGIYKVELWGAKGGKGRTDGAQKYAAGMGGYTTGTTVLNENEDVFIYVGGAGGDAPDAAAGGTAGYNGGGKGGDDSNPGTNNEPGGGGGGATDIRIYGTSLNDRIMVAAGGGGSAYGGAGGAGGGLNGQSGNVAVTTGGYQTSGYGFGQGGPGITYTGGSGAGGGGYWGGKAGPDNANSGAGGSSYISGHQGSIAVVSSTSTAPRLASDGTECIEGTTDVICSYHYSGKVFSNTSTITGGSSMPNYNGTSTMTGNNSNGYAKITLLQLK